MGRGSYLGGSTIIRCAPVPISVRPRGVSGGPLVKAKKLRKIAARLERLKREAEERAAREAKRREELQRRKKAHQAERARRLGATRPEREAARVRREEMGKNVIVEHRKRRRMKVPEPS